VAVLVEGEVVMIDFFVLGFPAPQGSKTGFIMPRPVKQGNRFWLPIRHHVVLKESSAARVKAWRKAVAAVASDEMAGKPMLECALSVTIVFRMQRPKNQMGTGRNAGQVKSSAPVFKTTTPDSDKLARSTLDALTKIVFGDDSQVVRLTAIKDFVQTEPAGARIVIQPLTTIDELYDNLPGLNYRSPSEKL